VSAAGALAGLGIAETAGLLRSRSISAEELVRSHLDAIRTDDADARAFVHVDPDGALAAARRADAELARGEARSSLHGIPFGVKDTICVADMPMEAGSRALAGRVPAFDARVVRRLREGGAIVLGKQSTQEFACGQVDPPTVNAWDARYDAGGSSVGSAVAVARGTSMFAIGSDSVGSVRRPASANGVVGMIPTARSVSGHGMVPCSSTLDRIGWLTRTVGDAALVAGAVMPGTVAARGADTASPLAGARIGFDELAHEGRLDADVARGFALTLERLTAAGATLVPLDLCWLDRALPAANLIFTAEAASIHSALLASAGDRYGERTRHLLTAGLLVPARAVEAARSARRALAARLTGLFGAHRLDALAAPTMPIAPQLREGLRANPLTGRYNLFNAWANITDRPAVSVPGPAGAGGRPIGMQFVGRHGGEERLLRLSAAYETLIGPAPVGPGSAPSPDQVGL
jgi:aspartyl-tRNA(Asn)/glutamyl-tRNA(Gln) amidotransferase subunit A